MAESAKQTVHLDVVVVVSNSEDHARRDRQALKKLRAGTVLQFTSGSEAIDFLGSQHADLVLVDSVIADMDGMKLLKLLRLNMNLKSTPVVMVTAEGQKNRVLESIAMGVDGYVLRPYSQDTFDNHIIRAMKLERVVEIEESQLQEGRALLAAGRYDEAIEAFEELVSEENEAQKYYDIGCKCLARQKYGQAIIAFKKAVKINDLFAEAYKGLAEAYKAKGDMQSYMSYLQRAAETYAHFNKMEETKELFIEILKYDSNCPNPFNTLGVKLRKAGDVAGALHAYQQALELTPEDENIHFNMAKAFFFMGNVEASQDALCKALFINPGFQEGRKLHFKIAGREYVAPKGAGASRSVEETPCSGSLKDI